MPKKKKKKAAKKKKAGKKSGDKLLSLIPIDEIKKELKEEGKDEDYDREEIAKMFEAEDEQDESETTTEGDDAFDSEGHEEY